MISDIGQGISSRENALNCYGDGFGRGYEKQLPSERIEDLNNRSAIDDLECSEDEGSANSDHRSQYTGPRYFKAHERKTSFTQSTAIPDIVITKEKGYSCKYLDGHARLCTSHGKRKRQDKDNLELNFNTQKQKTENTPIQLMERQRARFFGDFREVSVPRTTAVLSKLVVPCNSNIEPINDVKSYKSNPKVTRVVPNRIVMVKEL
ncbi:hypothetical protein BGZ46_002878 [Entomortierella lignicola]|nr:hypothetical protein BGZ46_002878 [Entomortierella lignicola]